MIKKKIRHIHIHIMFVTFFKYLNLFLSICYTCYLYWKLRAFLKKEKVSPKVLKMKMVVFFVYSIDFAHPHRSNYQHATGHYYLKSWLGPTSRFCGILLVSTTIFKRVSEPPSKFVGPPTIKFLSLDHF